MHSSLREKYVLSMQKIIFLCTNTSVPKHKQISSLPVILNLIGWKPGIVAHVYNPSSLGRLRKEDREFKAKLGNLGCYDSDIR